MHADDVGTPEMGHVIRVLGQIGAYLREGALGENTMTRESLVSCSLSRDTR